MRIFIFSIFILLISFQSEAQTKWAEKGAEWFYSYNYGSTTGYVHIYPAGDTLIDGILCKVLIKEKVVKDYFSSNIDTLIIGKEYTYLDEDKVFVYRQGSFFVLYDFGTSVGSKWEVAGNINFPMCNPTDSVRVKGVSDSLVNGFSLRFIDIKTPEFGDAWGFEGNLLERVGSLWYMFPEPYCVTDVGEGGQLRCFRDDEFGLINFSGIPCDFVVGLEEKRNGVLYSVFPNPSNGTISVSGYQGSWSLVNAMGEILRLGVVSSPVLSELDLNLVPGFYLLNLGSESIRVIIE